MDVSEWRQAVEGDRIEEIVALRRQNTDLLSANIRFEQRAREAERQNKGRAWHMMEVLQIAGKALGYPWYKDDQKNFPGATEADGICPGDHVCDSIVEELANAYMRLKNVPDMIGDVQAFHKGCETADPLLPTIPDKRKKDLRWNLIDEEVNRELATALANDDMVEIADAIADSIYVLIGCALAYGIPLAKVWKEVQRSNMDKFDPKTGAAIRRADGKILKREGWTRPDIASIVGQAQAA